MPNIHMVLLCYSRQKLRNGTVIEIVVLGTKNYNPISQKVNLLSLTFRGFCDQRPVSAHVFNITFTYDLIKGEMKQSCKVKHAG